MSLQFPLDVAEVIELRDTINSAVDAFRSPVATTPYQHFADAVRADIDAIGIDRPHQADRLIRILAMLRQLYCEHRSNSKAEEAKLRQQRVDNRQARKLSIRYGCFIFIATTVGALTWLSLAEPGWFLKAGTVFLGYLSCDYFYSLSALGRYRRLLEREQQGVIEERIKVWNQKALTRRLALILGFKRNSNVFLISPKDVYPYRTAPGARTPVGGLHR